MLSVVLAVLSCAPAAQKSTDPEFKGFDYRAVHRDVMSLVADGKGEKAVELIDSLAPAKDTFGDDGRDVLRKRFAAIFGTAGKYVGQEVAGYKRLGSRVVKFYALAYFEKRIFLFVYVVVRDGPAGDWKLQTVAIADRLDELDQVAPFVPLGPAKD